MNQPVTAFNFDARTVAPSTGVADPLPAGWYAAMIDESEIKDTSDGQGKYIALRFNILEGQYAQRKVFARLNVRNVNAQAQEIAYKDLSAICHAIQVLDVRSSTTELHGKPMKIKVSLRAARPKLDGNGQPTGEVYEASNDIKAYRNINEPTDMAAATAPAGYAQAPSAPQGFGVPAQQPAPANWGAPVAAPAQQPVQQPWAQPAPQQPAQAPQQHQQYAPQPQQAPAQPWAGQPPAQPQFQQAPAQGAPQPWAQPQQQAPMQQPPAQQPPPVGSQPWAQQPAPQQQQAPAQQPIAQPWAQQQPAGGATPPWGAPTA